MPDPQQVWLLHGASLNLDADARNGQALLFEVHLQSRHKLAQFGGHSIGADQQAPLTFLQWPRLDRLAQGHGQQAAYRLQAATRSAHAADQTGQSRGLFGRLQKRDGVMTALGFGHGFGIIRQLQRPSVHRRQTDMLSR